MTEQTNALAGTALVLDFGSVVTYSIFERHEATERRLGLPAGSIGWLGPVDPEQDQRWREMLDDQLTEREYWAEMAAAIGKMVGEDWAVVDFLKAARSPDINEEIRPEMCELIRYAKANGASLAVLSNELELFYGEGIIKQIEILSEFDHIVDGTYTKILKPDPRAYQIVLDDLGMKPEQTVFVDDQPRNVAGADHVGMKSVYFDVRDPIGSIETARTKLHEIATQVDERHSV